MRITRASFVFIICVLTGCTTSEKQSYSPFYSQLANLSFIDGKQQYLSSPFVTAGDRVYMVGFQDGTFPDLGWHIQGEMGGIWDHPIKLMDGFTANITLPTNGNSFCLDKADKFTNYPMANQHHFTWAEENMEVERLQFVPDSIEGVIIEFRIINHRNEKQNIEFSFTGMTDLRPTWLGERTNMIDAEDEITFDEKWSAITAKDKSNPWYVIFGSLGNAAFTKESHGCPVQIRKGLGKEATLSYSLTIKANDEITIPFFVAGSYQSEESLRASFQSLRSRGNDKLIQKKDRYKKIDQVSSLTIPDKGIQQMYQWLKYNTDWLVRNVPEQGSGLSAGLPDYPWWFGADATYSLQGVMATGDHVLAKNTILLLHKLSQLTNANGRIIHEASTNGAAYNPGNVNETAQFITLVYNYYAWTGDKELVTQLFPDLKEGISWLLKEKDPDGNHYPNGSGMMEIPGLEAQLEMIDVATYTQQALASAAALASAVGELDKAAEYLKLADELKARINKEWWQADENSFGDFRGTVAEATPVLQAALIRSDTLGKTWAVTELKNTEKKMTKYPKGKIMPHVIYHNWVVNTPLETGAADLDKGKAALIKAKTYENPFGAFVTGIDRTEEADSVVLKSRKKIFSYTGAVMTMPTGLQAIAAARYGSPDAALVYLTKLHRSFSYALPGSMYEVSPDFGMMTQAWNIYGVAVPLVNFFFGIQPFAYDKITSISPALPASWKEASLDHIKVGNNELSIGIQILNGRKNYQIRQTQSDWRIMVDVAGAKKVTVDDKEIDLTTVHHGKLILKGLEWRVSIY